MKTKLIAIGLLFLGSAATYAVSVMIPDRKSSLEQSLQYIVENIQVETATKEFHEASLEASKNVISNHREEYNRVRCELYHLKKADGEETSPESDTVCSKT